MKKTPREELNDLNGNDGYYSTNNQFIILIENRIYNQATKIMNSMNLGFLWVNERSIHNQIYNYLLDGVSVKEIKSKFNKK